MASERPRTARVPLRRYVENLRAVRDLAAEHGASVAFLTRPVLLGPEVLEASDTWRSRVPFYNRAVLRFAEEVGAAVIDVEARFRGEDRFFVDLPRFTSWS